MKKADKLGARFVIIVGGDEVARGVAMVRSMADSQQQEVALDRLVDELRARLGA